MNTQAIFTLGLCLSLLLAFAAMEKGKGPLSRDFIPVFRSRPAPAWWKESHKHMKRQDSPWVWIEYSSEQQRKRQYPSQLPSPTAQEKDPNPPTCYTIPMPARSDEMEQMRQFRMQKLQEDEDIQRL